MTPADIALILTALVGGGALYKMIESIALTVINKGKSAREEFRGEIARLEAKLKEQEHKIEKLQEEIERQKNEKGAFQEKNIQLLANIQRLELVIETKDYQIGVLEDRIRRLRLVVRCSNTDNCPLLDEDKQDEEEDKGE